MPHTGGRLLAAARERGYPLMFSANAFSRAYRKGHEREGFFRCFGLPDPDQFAGVDATLDSSGYVAMARYLGYRWFVSEYLDLVASYPWKWWASMDYCCEPKVAANRPVRLLRLAATVHLFHHCSAEAARRGLPAPVPVLQGWKAAEYLTCLRWLNLPAYPPLMGVGSMCRRAVEGPDGILAVLEALHATLPPTVRVHLFGVKSSALDSIAHHPRVASIDSMAWDVQARVQRRTGRDVEFRVAHLDAWMRKQHAITRRPRAGAGVQRLLFAPEVHDRFPDMQSLVQEALALQFAELIIGGEITYHDAFVYLMRDSLPALALAHRSRSVESLVGGLNDLMEGAGDQAARLAELHAPI